jgi:hypothetical protein
MADPKRPVNLVRIVRVYESRIGLKTAMALALQRVRRAVGFRRWSGF